MPNDAALCEWVTGDPLQQEPLTCVLLITDAYRPENQNLSLVSSVGRRKRLTVSFQDSGFVCLFVLIVS